MYATHTYVYYIYIGCVGVHGCVCGCVGNDEELMVGSNSS